MKYQNGEDFLNHLNKNMHNEDIVMHTASKSDTPEEKIKKYMERLEKSHNKAKDNKHKMNILKQFYYNKYVIKTLPESYINLQKKIAHEQGYGNIDITKAMKQEMLFQIQTEQKNSLNRWIEYFCSDDAMYPMWFKNYAFEGMLKLGVFDKEKKEFLKRTKNTSAPYIDLNREVLAKVYDVLMHQIGENKLSNLEEQALANGESFKKLYTYFLKKVIEQDKSQETEGIWIKYEQGSDYHPLLESLQGKNTGWCTAGETVAREQLENGDFYIYYTKDKNNEYKNPRIAIRMDGKTTIGEIRGIAKDQNLEPHMGKILDEKLNEFPDKKDYQKKVKDMKYLTILEKKQEEGLEFSFDDLIFLYQINDKIDGFGWESDPRIMEIIQKRNAKKDLSIIFKISENEIAIKLNDFEENKNIRFFCGDLNWTEDKVPSYFSKLQVILGNADFRNLTDSLGLESLQSIKGNALFRSLTNAEGLSSLQQIAGDANFDRLTSAKGLESLQNIGGNAYFDRLTSAEGLTSLQQIADDANFVQITNAKGLESLQNIGGNAYFPSLISAKDLKSLQSIKGDASFDNLTSAKGLESLQNIGRNAYFYRLTSAKGLESLQSIKSDAYFDRLTSAKGLESLQNIGCWAYFPSLISAKDLKSLQSIKGDASFDNLTSAKGLELLQNIEGDANFNRLTSAEGLTSLQQIAGDANFDKITNAKGLESLQNVGGNAYFHRLTSAEGLTSLQKIAGDANFDEITNAKGLESLQNIGGNAYFYSLIRAEGLDSLQHIGKNAYFPSLLNAIGLESLQIIEGAATFFRLKSSLGLSKLQKIGETVLFDNLTDASELKSLQSVGNTTNQYVQKIIEKNNQTNIKHHH